MSQITTREFGYNAKHTSVSSQEMDTNFIYINDELKNKLVESDLYDNNTIQSLHKSPNAITSMFIYDTSKDSDGGAWTDKCQNTSWYNETLSGSWLGSKLSEIDARCLGATLGSDIAVNGSFTTDTNWTKGTGVTITNGTAVFTSVADNVGLTAAVAPLTTNLYYTITFTISSYVTGSVEILLGTTSVLFPAITNGTYSVSGVANSIAFVFRANGTNTYNVDNISIKPVLVLNTVASDYFQLISDGKFYSLSKNYLTTTATLATQTQFLTAGTYTISITGSSGSVAISGAATATHTAGTSTTFTVTTSGLVLFTVTGSVLTAQLELGISATTYSANTSTTRYSETFRGNKKEFPKLSAIIAETANVTIYDLTEKNNPMWLRFIVTANPGGAIGWNSSIKDVKCLNNLLVICHYGSNYRDVLHNIEFIKDTTITSGTSANIISYPTEFGINGNNISQRNVVGKFSGIGAYILYDSGVTNISMSILKNAPIDTITGLKIPTIALGSDTKCTIITNTGTIIQTPNVGLRIPVLNKKSLITARNNSSDIFFNNNPELLSNNFTENTFNNTTGPDFNASVCPDIISFKNNTYIRRTTAITPSIIQLLRHNNNNFVKGIAATITNNSNTGYQVGDIRRTYLSSNTVETITNTELLSNSSFTDSSAWTITAGLGVTIANDKLNFDGITSITNATTIISQNVNTIAGKTYKIVIRGNITGILGAYLGGIYQELPNIMPNNPWFVTASATGANTFSIRKRSATGVVIGYIDSISMVEQYIEDRSYIAKAADIYGTLTKSAVNTGADLVAYSGFSNTNYIRENYSSDLDFGINEFNISSWVKFSNPLGALGQTNRGWYGMTTLGTDVYCNVYSGDIYKQTNGTGNFIALGQISREWRAMTTLGSDIYACVTGGDIYKQTNGSGDFIALGQTPRQWIRMTTLGSDVYACVTGGDIYKQTNGTGDFIALGQTNRNWYGMASNGIDVYACVTSGDIYKQTNGIGNFIALGQTSRDWRGMGSNGSDVYACVYNGDIYKQTNGTGNFIALGQTTIQWVGMTTLGSDIYACVYNGDIYKFTPSMLTHKTIVERSYPTGPKISLTATNGGYVTANLYDGTTTKSVTTTNSFTTGIPAKVSASYKFGKLGIMVNGQEVATNLGLPLKALSGAWEEKAPQLNSQTFIYSLAVYNGKLYGGTSSGGRLFEWNGTNAWIEVANKLNVETNIMCLTVFNNKIYGGTYPNAKLFEWNGSNAWIEVATGLNSQTHILCLAEYNGKLYGGTQPNGKLFEWNGTNAWNEVAPQLNAQTAIYCLLVYNGKLYGGTSSGGRLFEWNGTNAWIEVAPQLNSQTNIFSLVVYNDKLYGVTGPNAKLFEWNGSNAWIEVATGLNSQTYIYSLAVYNGKLYGGTSPNGKLFEWNGSNAWIEVATGLNSQTYIYSLAVYNGKLYGGTHPNGKLFEWNGYGTDATLTIGNSTDLTAPFHGSLSLLKISGTVPTKEQEMFMYEQEKQLFNENAKCVLPDDTAINDISYDDITDTWKTNSNTNYSTWNNLVRTSNTTPIQGTFANTTSNSGIILQQRDLGTSLDGYVDVILPKYSVYKDFINNYNNANNVNLEPLTLDFIAGFQGTLTVGTNSITSITTITYPTDIIGATITGTNIPANTTIIDISGTTLYISNLITQGAGVNDISFKDYILPAGYEATLVTISGNTKIEGSTKDYTKLYDGFAETVSFNTAPAYTLPVQIQIIKDI